jgi:plasmid stabilization system protein ParE
MTIFFSKRAHKTYHKIKERITEEWGDRVAEAFEQKTNDFLDLLEDFPKIGTVEYPQKQIRGFQLTKQTKIFYRIKGQRIVILTFFDVRQDPRKRPR